MKTYELTVVIHPDLEMNTSPATNKVEKLISDNGGRIIKENNEGKKHLAYPIGGNEFGVYYYYEAELPSDAPQKISNVLNITDEIIRYLLVAADPRKAKIEAKHAEGQAEDQSEGQAGDESDAETTNNNKEAADAAEEE